MFDSTNFIPSFEYPVKLIYKKKFYSKSKAMSFEYKLKKDRSMRLIIIQKANAKKL